MIKIFGAGEALAGGELSSSPSSPRLSAPAPPGLGWGNPLKAPRLTLCPKTSTTTALLRYARLHRERSTSAPVLPENPENAAPPPLFCPKTPINPATHACTRFCITVQHHLGCLPYLPGRSFLSYKSDCKTFATRIRGAGYENPQMTTLAVA